MKLVRSKSCLALVVVLSFWLKATPSFSHEVPSKSTSAHAKANCGLLEKFVGEVEILDGSRTRLIEATTRAPLPCGAWISVNHGWAQIKHQNGPRIHLSSESFVQLPDFRKDPKLNDHVILYKGQLYATLQDSGDDFRMSSSLSRAKVKRGGKAIFLLDRKTDETQLVSIKGSATLENRFEPSRKVRIQAGETTSLNLRLKRVIPHLPSAVSVASLRPKLYELRMSEHDKSEAIQAVAHRQEKKWIAQSHHPEGSVESTEKLNHSNHSQPSGTRKIASEEAQKGQQQSHQPSSSPASTSSVLAEADLDRHFKKKMVGGAPSEDQLLNPQRSVHPPQEVKIEVINIAEKLNQKIQRSEAEEKKRLLEEFSKIKME